MSVVYIIKDHINKWLDAKDRDPRPAAVAKKFILLLDEFFENSGAEDRLLCLANMLHPFYKGHMLKLVNAYERTVEDLVDSHPSTVDWGAEQARLLQIELEGRDEIDRYVIEEARKASFNSVRIYNCCLQLLCSKRNCSNPTLKQLQFNEIYCALKRSC